jgi:uncharacterized delta-60 repeat protein
VKENYKSDETINSNLRVLIALAVFFAGVFLGPGSAQAQAWVARYNGPAPANDYDVASAIAVDRSGNVYVTGSSGTSIPLPATDYVTIKYNSAGQQQWVARYNGPANGDDRASAIAVDRSGNVYVTGSSGTNNPEEFDYVTIKYNSAGQQQWVARYNRGQDDAATAIAVDSSGNVYVTGYSGSFSNFPSIDYTTIKYNSSGQQRWVANYNGTGNFDDWALTISIDDSGNVYVTGQSTGTGANLDYDYATIKYSAAGQQQWVARYDGPAHDYDVAQGVAIDGSGNVYVTGQSPGSGTGYDYATIKYNAVGQQQWVARYNGPANSDDGGHAIAVDNSANIYVTGGSHGSGTDLDYATIKYNSAGQQQWVARYNGPFYGWDRAGAIALDSSGNVYVTGESAGLTGGCPVCYDYATVKYNSAGQQQWVERYNGPGNGWDRAEAIAVDGGANVYVTGRSAGSGTGDDYATIKYGNNPIPTSPTDFNKDGHPDYLLYNTASRATWIWYMNNNVRIGSAAGPTIWGGWSLASVADFNRDGHPDYLLFNSATRATWIWYMNNNVRIGNASGPTLPVGSTVVALGDFNRDGYPDYLLFNANTRGTVAWYMRNNVRIGSASGPALPAGQNVAGVADFNGDTHPDYLLFNAGTHGTVIWYMSGVSHTGSHVGPTITQGYDVVGLADFDGNGRPDYLLYNSITRQTAVWYLNNYLRIGNAAGPTIWGGWSVVAP